MNPIRSYFEWHDANYLARAQDARKNQRDIHILQVLRVFLLITSALLGVVHVVVVALLILERPPAYSIPMLAFLFTASVLSYTWVTEALLFRRYIEAHKEHSETKQEI